MVTRVKCPQCQKEVIWSPDYPYRPFCSQRCQALDLGAWASEDHKLPAQEEQPTHESLHFISSQ